MSALDRQEDGSHYKDMTIQPIEFCMKNNLNACESKIIKYVCRHRNKHGAKDLRKAIHMLELLMEFEYPEEVAPLKDWQKWRILISDNAQSK